MAMLYDDIGRPVQADALAGYGVLVMKDRGNFLIFNNDGQRIALFSETEMAQLYDQVSLLMILPTVEAANLADYIPLLRARLESLDKAIAEAEAAFINSNERPEGFVHVAALREERKRVVDKIADITAHTS